MNERRQDFELLQRFTRHGEESAFTDLVRRHLDLVFATALRKVADPDAAQEIAQNVFSALARKAWRFAPDDSLPSWLHKAVLLESKSWLRGELGRRRREETAAELGTTMNSPADQPAFHALVPLLDEALLSLREKDRTALLLRFYESHSLRDVGAAFGVSEDTAQKRVQSALEKLAEFFKRRGSETATVAAAAAALQHTATTASATVAGAVVNAALRAAPPALAGFGALLARLASLTMAQKTAVGIVLAAAALFWLWRDQRPVAQRLQLQPVATELAAKRNGANNLQTNGRNMNTTTLTQFSLPLVLSAGLAASNALGPNRAQAQSVSEPYTFTHFAGTLGGPGQSDGTGSAARFNSPQGVATDVAGNVYVADYYNLAIRKITPSGVVTTLAGQEGSVGSADGTGNAARFYLPAGVATDAAGNVYVSDSFNHTIRKITPAGVVTTLAGLAETRGNADGTGSTARFNSPEGVATDAAGNVYVADGNQTIRKITPTGVVTTLAGLVTGSADGTGSEAGFNLPRGVATDAAGNVYVADTRNHTIRKITPAGVVTTLAGLAGSRGSTDGTGSAARFWGPYGVATDAAGNVYVGDRFNRTIRKITPAGVVTTLAGLAGSRGSTDGTGSAARFGRPHGVATDAAGNVYVAERDNQTIRKITPAGVVTTLAGLAGDSGSDDGTGSAARFSFPVGLALDSFGNLYVGDKDNHTIRKITPGGVVSTLAGLAGSRGSNDGTGSDARFNGPYGVATSTSGNVYVAEGVGDTGADTFNHTIRKITPGGVVSTLAGLAGSSGSADGTGSAARFWGANGVATDAAGNVYVADHGNETIRKITPAGVVSTLAGLAGSSGSADGTGSAAQFSQPIGVATDAAGHVYVAELGNATIRKITPAGVVTTLAGLAGSHGSDDGTGSAARFSFPVGIAVDSSGNVYVAADGTIRKITPAGVVTTLAGLAGRFLNGSEDGTGSAARFNYPHGIAVDSSGNVYVADSGNHCIRKGAPNAPPVADASATVTSIISPNGINATVILDGSRSSDPDPDGGPLQYTWYENGAPLATGVVARPVLPVGTHTIALVVNDGTVSATNAIAVEVITPATAVSRLVRLVENADLGRRNQQPLLATLFAARSAFDRGNVPAALNQLSAFQNQVRAQIAPSNPTLADQFITAARQIISVLSAR